MLSSVGLGVECGVGGGKDGADRGVRVSLGGEAGTRAMVAVALGARVELVPDPVGPGGLAHALTSKMQMAQPSRS